MKVKDLINKLSEYDLNLDICMRMYCVVEDGYYTANYHAFLEDVYINKTNFPISKPMLILYGDTDHLDKYLEEK